MKVKLNGVSIKAIASTYPKDEFDLMELAAKYGETEVKRIIASTGVSKIRVAPSGMCSSDLCEKAAKDLFLALNIEPGSIDGIVFVSQTFDHIVPATSVLMQQRLGISKHAVAFDIRYGCSGYIYGLYQGALLVSSGSCQRVLVCVGDVSTHLIHPDDRALRMVMGDAGSSTIIEKGDEALSFNIMSDGSGADFLIIPAGGCRYPSNENSRIASEREGGNIRSDENLFMDGMEIMNFCLREVPPCINDLLNFMSWEKVEVGFFGLHQANKFIVDYLQKKLKVPKETVPVALQLTGNTGPASIPLMLSLENQRLRSEKRLEKAILCAFGVGLSWGAVGVDLSKTIMIGPSEL
ncbi:MAG: ketoacyl-ACP synthase III [Ignavibacteria bacterium]|nr:ketoacyl-ACP synthase III [Ignavibacteria bacterium]